MTSTPLDPIEIEAVIKTRLEARLKAPGLVKFVYDTKGYGNVEEESQLVPSLAVIYNGFRAGEAVGQGAAQAVPLEFLVVIVARSSTNTLRATGAKSVAGSIFHEVMGALLGWKPAPGLARLTLGDSPPAGYSDAGFVYFPVAFLTRATYTPTPDP